MKRLTKRSEAGAALIISTALIVALLTVAAFVLTLSFRARERTRLQVASDTSAQAAAAVICSSKECWDRSRNVALETLRINAKLDNTVEFNGSDRLPNGDTRTRWESGGYTIEVERGMWAEDGNFVSLENGWQANNPGKPKVASQNAIRISLSRSILPLIDFGINGMLRASAGTTALAQPVGSVCVAPFAIPVCALYNQDGDIDQKQLCATDRLFTSVERYCPNGADCDVLPDFDYDPLVLDENLGESQSLQQANFESSQTESGNTEVGCFFPTPRLPQTSDHFGVVGIPGTTPASAELVRSALMQPGGCMPASIGEQFSILSEGLTTTDLGDLVWSQITNAPLGGSEDDAHVAFARLSKISGFDGVSQNFNRAFTDHATRSTCDQNATSVPANPNWGVRQSYGVCNSRRSDFGNWASYNDRSPSSANPFGSSSCPLQDQIFNQTAWRAKIPIIAKPGENAASCAGTLGVVSDPDVELTQPYEIVGFVSVMIFDADIGTTPPSLDNFTMGSEARGCVGIGQGAQAGQSAPPPQPSAMFPFGFVGSGSTPTMCNLVRARIDCNSKIIASSFDNQRNRPRIVQ